MRGSLRAAHVRASAYILAQNLINWRQNIFGAKTYGYCLLTFLHTYNLDDSLCVYIYVCIHACMHVSVYVYTHAHARTHIYTLIYAHVRLIFHDDLRSYLTLAEKC